MLEGRCECGEVRFTINGEIQELSHCHCSQCRRLHGAAFATFATVDRKSLDFVSGETGLTPYKSSATITRHFCSQCGSTLIAGAEEDYTVLYVSMSALEGEPAHPPAYHEFVGSKANWHEILDDCRQYEESKS